MSEEGELLSWTSCDLSQVAHGDVAAVLLLPEDCAPPSAVCVWGVLVHVVTPLLALAEHNLEP